MVVAAVASELKFEAFRQTEQYRCGQFIESSINDPAMRLLRHVNNMYIQQMSKPFPHEKLLSSDALLGNLEAWKDSLKKNQNLWIDFEWNWIISFAFIAFFPVIATFLFLFYRCYICCRCSSGDEEKSRHTDRRFDSFRRIFLNILIALFIIGNVFCSAVILISIQYAQYGMDELPTRLHYCVNDFSIYRSETNDRVRKLLRDDFIVLNSSLYRGFDNAGDSVVAVLKEKTGAVFIDELIDKTNGAESLNKQFSELKKDVPQTISELGVVRNRLFRLQDAVNDLHKCEQASASGIRANICYASRQAIQSLIMAEGTKIIPSESQQKEQLDLLLPEQIPSLFQQIIQLDIEAKFSPFIHGMEQLRDGIQNAVDLRREDAIERLKLMDNTFFRLFEDISQAIKSIDLRFLEEKIVDPLTKYREEYRTYVKYSWIGSLVFAGIFAFIALTFLLGLFYGSCGRRPSEYDDDCCVRTTGSTFFNCGVWLCMIFLTLFGLVAAVLMFIGGNASWLVCDPMRTPLARPDIISLFDRIVSLHGIDQSLSSSNQQQQTSSNNALSINTIFTAKRRPADLIRGCAHGQTFYTIFGMDGKFKLLDKGGPMDEYENLVLSIRQMVSSKIPKINPSDIGVYGRDMFDALRQLEKIHLPMLNSSSVELFCSRKTLFPVDQILIELRRLHQQSAEQKAMETITNKLDSIIRFLDEIKPQSSKIHQKIESECAKLQQLQRNIRTLRFNDTALSNRLEQINAQINAGNIDSRLREAAGTVVDGLGSKILQYARHINKSISTEVTSCSQIAEIAKHSREAICDYALDQYNVIWMALCLGILLIIPIIPLSQTLNTLYRRAYPYTHLAVSEIPNESAFATDIYERTGAGMLGESRSSGHGHAPPLKISHPLHTTIASPYASTGGNYSSYNNYDLYPPPYMMTSTRRY